MIRQGQDATDRYRQAGVDIAAGNAFVDLIKPLAARTARPGSAAHLGGFGAVFDLRAAGFADPLLVATTDGIGTKLLLASEAGDLDGIGIDLVAMCVNDLVVQGATPLFFLDYFATSRLDPEAAARVVAGIASGCGEADCALVGGETAEMPGLYAPGHFDLAGFAVGAVERSGLLPRSDIAPDDVLLGLASSGLHSNGFSLVRMLLQQVGVRLDAPAPFAPEVSLAEALLSPTRIYVRSALAAISTGGIKAMAHVTGGGLYENLPRILPPHCVARIDARSWPLPPVFRWLKRQGALSDREIGRTFNAGIGLVLVVSPGLAGKVVASLRQAGETVFTIGDLTSGHGPAVAIEHTEVAWSAGASPF